LHVTFADLSAAVGRSSALVVLAASAVSLVNLVLAGFRWRVLLAAYGAKHPPGVPFLARAQIVGHFYNTFVPGNVTGDFVRAYATRHVFDAPLGSYMVVAIDRFFGLAGVFALSAVALVLHPLPGVTSAVWPATFAAGAAFAILLIPVAGRRVGGLLPGRIGKWAAGLPAPARPGLLGVTLLLAMLSHTLVAVAGHLLVSALAPQVTLSESFVLIPLVTVATYFPFAVAGLGVRELAFTFLFGKVGVAGADATAASLGFFASYAILACLGGVLHLVRPLEPRTDSQ
jgi:uncharacterized membrane protein YbhN (UPF0104 family)